MKTYEISEHRLIRVSRQVDAETPAEASEKFDAEELVLDPGVEDLGNKRPETSVEWRRMMRELGPVKPMFTVHLERQEIQGSIMNIEANDAGEARNIARNRLQLIGVAWRPSGKVTAGDVTAILDHRGKKVWDGGK